LKNLLICLSLLVATSSSFAQTKTQIPNEVTLNHRLLNPDKCKNSSCYFDFFNMVQNYGAGLSVGFGNDGDSDELHGVLVVDEMASIVDLGKMSCQDIPNEYENRGHGYPEKKDRVENPMFWLSYSNAWDRLQKGEGKPNLSVTEGHCYLMYKTSSYQKIIVAFNVKKLDENFSVTLSEIEVFQRGKIVDLN
jgi:hypothetical protein